MSMEMRHRAMLAAAEAQGRSYAVREGTYRLGEGDYEYTRSANAEYTGSILIETGLSEIVGVLCWDEAWVKRTQSRTCFGVFSFSGDGPAYGTSQAAPYYYGAGYSLIATASNWLQLNGNAGPILHQMHSSVPEGSFGIKTHAGFPIKAGAELHWIAWGRA